MSVENCKQCNRDMGYNSEEFELCAPCELGFTEKNNKRDARAKAVTDALNKFLHGGSNDKEEK